MTTARRGFLGQVTAAALGLSAGLPATALARSATEWDDSWTKHLGSSHRFVFDMADMARASSVLDEIGTLYSDYHEALGTPDRDMHVVLVIRHSALALALGDALWDKYAIGELRSVKDPATDAWATRNPMLAAARPTEATTAIDALQRRGVTLLACNRAMVGLGESIAEKQKLDRAAVEQDLRAGLLPGVTLQVNGVYARLRAQDAGCVLRTND